MKLELLAVSAAGPIAALALVGILLAAACTAPAPRPTPETGKPRGGDPANGDPAASVRLALFNVRELSAAKLAVVDASGAGRDPQLRAAAQIVQRVRPDVLVVQEIDFPAVAPSADPAAHARAFADRYLANGADPLAYPYAFAAPVNTGFLSGLDLNRDGVVATAADEGGRVYGDDSLGWGTYPGQYGMAVLSRWPLAVEEVRTFQHFLWRDLPGNHLPPGYYEEEALARLPLSSKSHWDLPVLVPGSGGGAAQPLHLWISHPTPPVFDGPEDRNGRRNFDEVRFWKLYLEGAPELVDDAGGRGGYRAAGGEVPPFVVVGDLNADPRSPEAVYDGVQSVRQLLDHPDLADAGGLLTSAGARAVPRVGEEGAAAPAEGDPAGELEDALLALRERSTAAWETAMRLDHLIPGGGARAVAGGVFWPAADADPEGHALAETASDHRLVWLDLVLPEAAP